MASEVGSRMNDLVARMAPQFRARGFTRAARNFHRAQTECVQRVNIHGSSTNGFGGHLGAPQFFVELYVYFGEYRREIGEAPLDRPTSTFDLWTRLEPPGSHGPWTGDIADPAATVHSVMDAFDRVGEPFFRKYPDLQAVERSVDEQGGPPAHGLLGLVSFERSGRRKEWWSTFRAWASSDLAARDAKQRDSLLDKLDEAGRADPTD